jgi:pyrimidine operon attenuation protein/uracil phosphoribosyltransferase
MREMIVESARAKAVILDADGIRRAWRRIAHELIERQPGLDRLVLFGIVTRGVPLAQRLSAAIAAIEGIRPPVVPLDVRAFRDDRPRQGGGLPGLSPDTVQDRSIVLVDDVLFHGRTVRAAIEAMAAAGRPRRIQLAVLVDRGHRDLPIRPDYVGKNVPTSLNEWIEVHLSEVDGEDVVRILERPPA